jgi:hypothetical protein
MELRRPAHSQKPLNYPSNYLFDRCKHTQGNASHHRDEHGRECKNDYAPAMLPSGYPYTSFWFDKSGAGKALL